MAGQVVYDDVAEGAHLEGQLFAGKNFWVAQRCPSRPHFKNLIESNGGRVVPLEKNADYLIADHVRKDCPAGSISYKFIEESIKRGELQDPEDHPAGPPAGTAREAGSTARPTKIGRAAYTLEEDRILYHWVKDHEAKGVGSASGNEIYKQLQEKYPRHTWQSWRDRYLKQLRDRPPSTFALPSPTSGQSAAEDAPVDTAPKHTKPAARQTGGRGAPLAASSSKKPSSASETITIPDYSVDDFNGLFSTEDWEELYANVPIIQAATRSEYRKGWKDWAENTTCSAEQWQQYFEKVVEPQYEQDPESKRAQIAEKVRKKHAIADKETLEEPDTEGEGNEGGTPSEQMEQAIEREEAKQLNRLDGHDEDENMENAEGNGLPFPDAQVKDDQAAKSKSSLTSVIWEQMRQDRRGKPPWTAYKFYTRWKRQKVWDEYPTLDHTDVQRILLPEWKALTVEEKAPYDELEEIDRQRFEDEDRLTPEPTSPQVGSSHTALQKTPEYLAKAFNRAKKRILEGVSESDNVEESSSPKRQKRNDSTYVQQDVPRQSPGTKEEPVELSSGGSSSTASDEELLGQEPLAQESIGESHTGQARVQFPDAEKDNAGEFIDIDELDLAQDPGYPQLPPPPEDPDEPSDDLPSNTPTPRASRHNTKFDTQAILSSPSQDFPLAGLPRPGRGESPADAEVNSSPGRNEQSIASATQSLEEFRRSLTEANDADPTSLTLPKTYRTSARTRRRTPDSVIPASEHNSQESEDPDPPLEAEEFDDFYEAMRDNGFSDDEVTVALRTTKCRPELTITVLEGWQERRPLPWQRGVWSESDDEDLASGDGIALAELEVKHTRNGWGGTTERAKFLEQWRKKHSD
ncbi:hypothetical protein BDV96DRAFT_598093 [Lophiotrema nucula]|uniref:DNA-binding protein RAP1 n=1 Tax=Lophiotrema nucula TaxID=690887 RepID=A0A6A5ZCF0_9PLEO|nr:hypothetical protein BDV96DRAFT_598093 [Lophiotrema nucula]